MTISLSASRPRRTGHPPVSYRDDSTDDETTDPPANTATKSCWRLRKTNHRQTTLDEHSDFVDEFQAPNARDNQAREKLGNPSRTTRSSGRITNVINYTEDSDAEYGVVGPELTHNPVRAPNRSTKQRKRPRSTKPTSIRGPFESFKRRKANHDTFESFNRRKADHDNSRIDIKGKAAVVQVILLGRIPPWQTLPYQVLLSILQYASYPFYRDASHDTGSIGWLTRVSTLSRSFHDAAISTLLYSPPLFPADRAHGLQQLLDAPQEILSTNYRKKIKRLDIEVRNLLIKKSGIDLISLIKQTPLLSALHLYHNYDRVGAVGWAQPSAPTGRAWSYPLKLFEALDENDIRLKGWSWNGRFPDTSSVLDGMKKIHCRQCLTGLTSLSVVNLAAPARVKEDEQDRLADTLTTALKALPGLEELNLQNCSIVNRRVLASLPSRLRHLSIINCGNFNSADLRWYLADHGYELEELVLNGNQALNLGFADTLQSLCPRLQLFKMDLTYSDPTAYHDVEPHYEAVFPEGNMPTWPRTLQTIEIENLRKLDAQDAEKFLGSLISIAPELEDLRKLSIRILLQHDGWRERAKLRQTWMPKLEDVFLRKAAPPVTFLPSALLGPQFPATNAASRPSTSHSKSSSSFTTDDSTAGTPNKRKSARIAKRELDSLANESFRKARSTKKSEEATEEDLDTEILRQGLCSEVILHIDGQRPADEQFKEADFLDDELSGDEDWNGKDVEAPSRYAW